MQRDSRERDDAIQNFNLYDAARLIVGAPGGGHDDAVGQPDGFMADMVLDIADGYGRRVIGSPGTRPAGRFLSCVSAEIRGIDGEREFHDPEGDDDDSRKT